MRLGSVAVWSASVLDLWLDSRAGLHDAGPGRALVRAPV
jgi:hypothetical protein